MVGRVGQRLGLSNRCFDRCMRLARRCDETGEVFIDGGVT